jgi:hypothetical protein
MNAIKFADWRSQADKMLLGSVESIRMLRDLAASLENLLQRSQYQIQVTQSNLLSLERRIGANQARISAAEGKLAVGGPAKIDIPKTRIQVDEDQLSIQQGQNFVRHVQRCMVEELRLWHGQHEMFLQSLQLWSLENQVEATLSQALWNSMLRLDFSALSVPRN